MQQSICSRLRLGHAADFGSAHGRDRDSGSSGVPSTHTATRARGGANAEAEAEARVAFAAPRRRPRRAWPSRRTPH
eukprot:scaffold6985_cov90-Isochrysis_galbana.AAC.1